MSASPTPEPEGDDINLDEPYDEPPPNHGQSPPFELLTRLYLYLQNERKHDKRRSAITRWFQNYRTDVGSNLYEVIRLLLPQKDRERAVYQVKEKNLAKLFIKAIPLGPKDPDSIRLLNWKRPNDENKATGDFPAVLFDVVSKRSSVTKTKMTVKEVNEMLDGLAKAGGKRELQQSYIQLVYNRCTPADQRWIVRIILKDLQISVKETTVFAVFHPDAQALFNTCSDLKRVAYQLYDPSHRLNPEAMTVQLFRSFAPMLCKRPLQSIEDSVKRMGGSQFYIEEKLDGERMQLHKRGNEYFYCSRKGKDYTYLYGRHVGEGSLTPFIHNKAFHENAADLILDGEMLVYDPVSNRYLPFGNLKTAALDQSKGKQRPRPYFKVFDILMINGKSLLEKSTTSRKKNLHNTVRSVPGRLEIVTGWMGSTEKDVRKHMEDVMNNRGEGLVIKHPLAQYVLNGRNEDWIKVKPEYLDNMGETFDLLVVGGQFGTGYRGGGVSTLICAVRDDLNGDDDDGPARYRTFVRIGSGLTWVDYQGIRERPWKPFDKKKVPRWLLVAPDGNEDKGDVYLEPEDSFILKIRAAEITPSDKYHMSFTMRFPRAETIRDDLDAEDCASASDVIAALRREKKRKIEDTASQALKKRKTTTKAAQVAMFAHKQAPDDINEVEKISDLFDDAKFHVIPEGKPTKPSIATEKMHGLQRLIVAHGGDFSAGWKGYSDIFIVYGGKTAIAGVSMAIRAGRSVIKPKWITDSIKQNQRKPLRKRYYFSANDEAMDSPEYDVPDSEQEADEEEEMFLPPRPSITQGWDVSSTVGSSVEGDDDFEMVDASSTLKDEQEEGEETDPESVQGNDDEYDTHEYLFGDGGFEHLTLEERDEAMAEMEAEPQPMSYDPEKLFRHLHFYIDTVTNAKANGLKVKEETNAAVLNSTQDKIESLGGKIVGLDSPLLSHVLFDPDDTVRRLEIKRRLPKDKERYLIISEWVDACIEANTLVDERMFDA